MHDENKIEEVVNNIQGYINTRYELIILKASAKISTVVAELISGALIVFITILCLLFLSCAAAFYLSAIMGNNYLGFLVIGGIYFIIALVIFSRKNFFLIQPFRDKIIRKIFKEENP